MTTESERVSSTEDLRGIAKTLPTEFMLLERVLLSTLRYLNGFGSCLKIFIKFVVLSLSKELDPKYLLSSRVLRRTQCKFQFWSGDVTQH